ncbi:MAG: ATP-dependent DNA helicase RecG [Coriobacteriia bacterium]
MTPAADPCSLLAAHALPVERARFVDSARASALAKLGVKTIGDLLRHYPARYLDLSHIASLADVRVGSDGTVVGRVHEIRVKKPRPRLTITEVAIVDGTGVLLGVWFNQPYIERRFAIGETVAFAGKIDLDFGLKQIKSPFVEKLSADDSAELRTLGHVLPVHRATEGLSTNWLRRLVAAAVDDYSGVPDHLPAELRESRRLMPLSAALRAIHFPADLGEAAEARRRLAYDEVLMLQLYMAMRRHALTEERAGTAHRIDGAHLARLRGAVPFELTGDQTAAVAEILGDMESTKPMNRLLLGDVGTGKTLVAAHALAAAADTGTQAAMMAPTEVLAEQYVRSVGPLLDAAGIPWGILTGSTPAAARRQLLAGVADGSVTVLFGTHALLEEAVAFKSLSLAIVDEQHRFGVNQRLGLRGKGAAADLLVMTATPIPRSLALTLYGDMETSFLRERPLAQAAVKTSLLPPSRRPEAYKAIRKAVEAGHQAYVVCALVEESETAETRAATRECERLQKVFPKLRIGLLTGRQRGAEKTRVMQEFRDRSLDVLVATTVIEVGVDVPNATVMLVEDAERFGLAQLHQLRGRVGRGKVPGEVFLVSEARTRESKERLRALAETADGFELAELDLKLRGEGHILGDQQHGLPALKLVSVLTDADLIEAARSDAQRLIGSDPHLGLPAHGPLLREVHATFASAWEWVSSG